MQCEGGRANVDGRPKDPINQAGPDADEGRCQARVKNRDGDRLITLGQGAVQAR